MQRATRLENLMTLQLQINQKRQAQSPHEYSKPHFGPEETEEMRRCLLQRRRQDQDL